MADSDDFGAFLIGFLIGGLTGAAVSLIFAPQSGEETRALIREKAIQLQDEATDTAEATYTKLEAAAADARARADELSKLAKQRLEELQRRGQVVLESTKGGAKKQEAASPAPAEPEA